MGIEEKFVRVICQIRLPGTTKIIGEVVNYKEKICYRSKRFYTPGVIDHHFKKVREGDGKIGGFGIDKELFKKLVMGYKDEQPDGTVIDVPNIDTVWIRYEGTHGAIDYLSNIDIWFGDMVEFQSGQGIHKLTPDEVLIVNFPGDGCQRVIPTTRMEEVNDA